MDLTIPVPELPNVIPAHPCLTTLTDQKICQEDKCRISIVYLVLLKLAHKWHEMPFKSKTKRRKYLLFTERSFWLVYHKIEHDYDMTETILPCSTLST